MNNGIKLNLKKKQITITVENGVEFKYLIFTLKKKLPELENLYKGMNPQILVAGKTFKNREIYSIQKLINKYFDVDVNFTCSKMLGLHGIRKTFKKEIANSKTKFVKSSLRCGQKIEYEGSVVVLGDINYGAEVIAGENVIVLGILRGMAHAGAKGNRQAIITASSIEATQIRIANVVKGYERGHFNNGMVKTNAYLSDANKIVVE